LITGDKETFVSAKGALTQKLAKLEKIKSDHDYFNGDQFMMIDAAIAPFFMRVSWINEFTDNALSLEDFPKIQKWSRTLLSDKDVMESVEEGLDDVYYSNIEARGAHLSTLLVD
jgi:glutathione S-transferase